MGERRHGFSGQGVAPSGAVQFLRMASRVKLLIRSQLHLTVHGFPFEFNDLPRFDRPLPLFGVKSDFAP